MFIIASREWFCGVTRGGAAPGRGVGQVPLGAAGPSQEVLRGAQVRAYDDRA